MKNIVSFITLLSTTIIGYTQDCIHYEEADEIMKSGESCSNYINYIPLLENLNAFPSLTVKVNAHFFRKNDGSGIYQPPLETTMKTIIEDYINSFYDDLDSPTLPVSPPAIELPTTKIQFELQDIYFHDNSTYYIGSYSRTFHHTLYSEKPNCEINIYYYRDTSINSSNVGVSMGSFINMVTNGNQPQWSGGGMFDHAQLLAHELGHALGLPHTFQGNTGCGDDMFDDTYYPDENLKWLDCGPNEPYTNCSGGTGSLGISNNIMGYNRCRRYLSPKQIGYIRHNLITNPNKRKYLKDDYDATNSITVNSNQTWSDSKFVTGNITVKSGNTLTVKCNVYLADSSKVFVEQGAKLIIDGGKLTNSNTNGCNPNQNYWHGVQVYGDFYQHQYPAHNPTYQGLLVLQNGGTIEFAHDGARNWKNNSWGEIGGVIQSNGGVFRNNQIAPSSFNKIPHITMFFKT